MKDITQVIKEKEAQLERVKTELIALRYVAPLLFEEGKDNPSIKFTPSPPPPSPVVQENMVSAAAVGATGKGETKRWP